MIKKQVIELNLDRRLNYYHVQQQISDIYWNEIIPVLERSFDSISNDEQLIEIDRLELDLGSFSETEIGNDEWIARLKKKVEEKTALLTDPSFTRTFRQIQRNQGILEQWIFYMKHGYLSWNSDVQIDKWDTDILRALESAEAKAQLESFLAENLFLERMVNQSDENFLLRIIELFTGTKQELLIGVINELSDLNERLLKKGRTVNFKITSDLRSALWKKALSVSAEGESYAGTTDLCEDLVRFFLKQGLHTTGLNDFKDLPVTGTLIQKIAKENRKEKKIRQSDNVKLSVKQSSEDEIPDAGDELLLAMNENIGKDGIFIVNAGTILLHPFFKSLFGQLGLLKGNIFTGEVAQQICMLLIHYIGTGRKEAHEFELTLAKVLCGLPIEKAVKQGIILPDDFIAEADLMITEAISQWKILKNTSAAGLREGFLQRTGKLFSKNGNLYLGIEKSAIDILLDYLPWNLSIIKLPWMKDILRVEWR